MAILKNICNSIKIAFLPDIHIGNGKASPQKIHDDFEEFVYPNLNDIQMLVIGGDFFHTMLNMNCDAGVMAARIIDELIILARQQQFYIRVIRGTFSHDRLQNRFWEIRSDSQELLDDRPLVKVATSISTEIFPKWDLSLLYCPDDQPTSDLTGTLVNYITGQGLDKVDIVCSHGYYEHLLPGNMDHIPNNMVKWSVLSNYVRGCVLNGHVHFHSVHDRVVSGGSFERFVHGEEEDKGFYIVTYDLTSRKVKKYDFIINTKALPFITVDSTNFSSMEECSEYIDKLIKDIRDNKFHNQEQEIYLCIVGTDNTLANYIKTNYQNVSVKFKSNIVQHVVDLDVDTAYDELPKITEDNLPTLIWDRIKDKMSTVPQEERITIEDIEEILKDDSK